jgi:hypothetical protein
VYRDRGARVVLPWCLKINNATGLLALIFALIAVSPQVRADSCVFIDDTNTIRSVDSLSLVPRRYRKAATCKDIRVGEVIAPHSMDVGRLAREVSFGTSLGTMHVRWARDLERCYRATPSKAIAEAARTVRQALRVSKLYSEVGQKHRTWDFVLTDRLHALSQVPTDIIRGRHPGFMLPPNRVYILSDFIAQNCQENPISDRLLAQVLLHEMGHVVEYILLGEPASMSNRERGEGFATWFEHYASEFSKTIGKDRVSENLRKLGTQNQVAQVRKGSFNGTALDYARAAMPFFLLVSKKGTGGVARLYRDARIKQIPLHEAVRNVFGWSDATYRTKLNRFTEQFLSRLE